MEDKKDNKCKGNMEVYSRVTGFYRPVQNYNKGKEQEFKDRVKYDLSVSSLNGKPLIEEKVFTPTPQCSRKPWDYGKILKDG